jgi:hypothetical protein
MDQRNSEISDPTRGKWATSRTAESHGCHLFLLCPQQEDPACRQIQGKHSFVNGVGYRPTATYSLQANSGDVRLRWACKPGLIGPTSIMASPFYYFFKKNWTLLFHIRPLSQFHRDEPTTHPYALRLARNPPRAAHPSCASRRALSALRATLPRARVSEPSLGGTE